MAPCRCSKGAPLVYIYAKGTPEEERVAKPSLPMRWVMCKTLQTYHITELYNEHPCERQNDKYVQLIYAYGK